MGLVVVVQIPYSLVEVSALVVGDVVRQTREVQ